MTWILSLLVAPLLTSQAVGQGLFSVDPANGASGVSPTKTVLFVFELPMDDAATSVSFIDLSNPLSPISFTGTWTVGNSRLTCIPSPAWPAGTQIFWFVDGADITGDPVSANGSFRTSGTGGGGGSGTNAITYFVVQAAHNFIQTNAVGPTIDPDIGYAFFGLTSLASNRTATAITLEMPAPGGTVDLIQNIVAPEDYYYQNTAPTLDAFNTQYPSGTYRFTVNSNAASQVVDITLQPATEQPPAPRIANFAAAQSVNPTQAFTLNWDPATSTDYILVEIGSFRSPDPGTPDALTGSASSILIPANTLGTSQTYPDAIVTFFKASFSSTATDQRAAIRATQTRFSLQTTDGSVTTQTPILTNITASATGTITFEVQAAPGQSITIEASADLQPNSWSGVQTSAADAGGRVVYTETPAAGTRQRFFRAR